MRPNFFTISSGALFGLIVAFLMIFLALGWEIVLTIRIDNQTSSICRLGETNRNGLLLLITTARKNSEITLKNHPQRLILAERAYHELLAVVPKATCG